MYEAATAGLVLMGTHVAIVYAAAEVFKLDYPMYLAVTVGIGVITGLLLKMTASTWKQKIAAAFKEELQEGDLLIDVLLFIATMIASGIATAYIVWRRYGAVGWAGSLAANYIASWVV